MWIQNVAAIDFQRGQHYDPGANSMAIQILDDANWIPEPAFAFKDVHRFFFLDLEDGDENVDARGITDDQAEELVRLLDLAKLNNMNVIVHCTAGVCRSGAVVEVATVMGFSDTGAYRQPNMRVKAKMLRLLGPSYYTYD